MRFWLSHSGEVPLQDQIVAQVTLGILSGELAPGERLPSTRQLALRFGLHPNTVSLAYRRLVKERWCELRRGSGLYVRASTPHAPGAPLAAHSLDTLLAAIAQAAHLAGLTHAGLHARLDQALARGPQHAPASSTCILYESDQPLAAIILAELRPHLRLPLAVHPLPSPGASLTPAANVCPLVLPSKAAALQAALPDGHPLAVLRIRSVPQALAPWLPAPGSSLPADALVAVASAWPPFLEFARTLLVAAGFSPELLLLRNAAEPGWCDGLALATATICDSATAQRLPPHTRIICFPLLADDAVATLAAVFPAAVVTPAKAPQTV